MKILLFALLLIPLLITPAFAQQNSQTAHSEKGTLDVRLSYDDPVPGQLTTLKTEFINPQTQEIQPHIDWRFSVSKDGQVIWGPTQLSHTSVGTLNSLKYEFPEDGTYTIDFSIEGILFQPIPPEIASFVVVVGGADNQPETPVNTQPETPVNTQPETPVNIEPNNPVSVNDKGGGCLIATATYGSELSPEVQQLREIRDNTLLQTKSGSAFMSAFNDFYYSFSPKVADYERENPMFKEAVKLTLTPMLSSLSLLNYIDIDSDQKMLEYGISLILLNLGMYVGIPVFGIIRLYQFRKN